MLVNELKRRLVRTAHPTVDAAVKAGDRVGRAHHYAQWHGVTAAKIAQSVNFTTALRNRHSGDFSHLELLRINRIFSRSTPRQKHSPATNPTSAMLTAKKTISRSS